MLIDQIKRCFLFYELLDTEIEEAVNDCVVASYADGETIYKEGDIGREFYVVLTGKVSITTRMESCEVEIMQVSKGEALGETVLTHENERVTTATARGNVDLLVINQDAIYSLYDKNPKTFGIVMLNLSRMLTSRLQKSNRTITRLHEKMRRAA